MASRSGSAVKSREPGFYLEIIEVDGYPAGLQIHQVWGFRKLPPGRYYQDRLTRSEVIRVFHWFSSGMQTSRHGPTGLEWDYMTKRIVEQLTIIRE